MGLVEDLSWMNDRESRTEVGTQIQAFLLPMFAEHKVREMTLGVFRGFPAFMSEEEFETMQSYRAVGLQSIRIVDSASTTITSSRGA